MQLHTHTHAVILQIPIESVELFDMVQRKSFPFRIYFGKQSPPPPPSPPILL